MHVFGFKQSISKEMNEAELIRIYKYRPPQLLIFRGAWHWHILIMLCSSVIFFNISCNMATHSRVYLFNLVLLK